MEMNWITYTSMRHSLLNGDASIMVVGLSVAACMP